MADRTSGGVMGRLAALVALGAVFNATYPVRMFLEGRARLLGGCVQAVLLLFVMGVYGWAASRAGEPRPEVVRRGALGLASVLVALNLLSNHLSGVLAVVYRAPPAWAAVSVGGGWLVLVLVARRRGLTQPLALVGFVGVVAAVRVIGLTLIPFHRISGDMLAVIDRGLSELFSGRFPYRDYPPPMPYFPLTFLAYAPCKALGLDLRWTNVICDAAAVWVAVGGWRRASSEEVSWSQLALPLLMLNPVWTYLSLDTHYAPSVLAAVVLGRVLASGSERSQALALGLAVAANQSFVLMGPIVAGAWWRRAGWRQALWLSGLAALVTVALGAPFLAWDAQAFVRMSLMFRSALPAEVMEGRTSLLPLLRSLGAERLAPVLMAIAVGLASAAIPRGQALASRVALGYAGALMFLGPVTFPHYFLPALAVLASGIENGASADAPSDEPRASYS